MKNTIKIMAVFTMLIAVVSCRPEIPSDIGPAYDAVSGFSGKW